MKRSISMSLAGVAAATTLVAGVGTTAVFNDTESRGGSLASGDLDFQVGSSCDDLADTDETHLLFDSENLKPGDVATYDICFSNVGSLEGKVTMDVTEYSDREMDDNGVAACSEPESAKEGDDDCDNGEVDNGELGQYLQLRAFGANCVTGEKAGGAQYTGPIEAFTGYYTAGSRSLTCFVYEVEFLDDGMDQNDAQSDVVSATIQFDLDQQAGESTDLTTIG